MKHMLNVHFLVHKRGWLEWPGMKQKMLIELKVNDTMKGERLTNTSIDLQQ